MGESLFVVSFVQYISILLFYLSRGRFQARLGYAAHTKRACPNSSSTSSQCEMGMQLRFDGILIQLLIQRLCGSLFRVY